MLSVFLGILSGVGVALVGYLKNEAKDSKESLDPSKLFFTGLFGGVAGYVASVKGISLDNAYALATTGSLGYFVQLIGKVVYAYLAKAFINLKSKLK